MLSSRYYSVFWMSYGSFQAMGKTLGRDKPRARFYGTFIGTMFAALAAFRTLCNTGGKREREGGRGKGKISLSESNRWVVPMTRYWMLWPDTSTQFPGRRNLVNRPKWYQQHTTNSVLCVVCFQIKILAYSS